MKISFFKNFKTKKKNNKIFSPKNFIGMFKNNKFNNIYL